MEYLAIDQYGHKTLLPDKKRKTLIDTFGLSKSPRVSPMYVSDRQQCGYVIGQGKDYIDLWLTIYKLEPAFEV